MSDVNTLFNFETHAISHPGKVRKINEDACINSDHVGLWAVADGMGGHSAGDVASHKVVTGLNNVKPASTFRDFVNSVEDQFLKSNAELREYSNHELNNRTIGSTVAALLIFQEYCAYMWAGDSRIYRLREGELKQLTRDHSQVEDMVEQGLLAREEADGHPDSNVITRAIGADDRLYIDMNVDEVKIGDTYLICSDGLSKHVKFDEIAQTLGQGTAIDICTQLINITLERGATDNVTVSVVKVQSKQ